MAAALAKFTFDLDLGQHSERPGFADDAARAAFERDARAAGYAEGFAAGEQNAAAAGAQAMARAIDAIVGRAAATLGSLDEVRETARREGVELAATIARKLCGALIARQPAAELEALLAECLVSLEAVPHLVIRCHPELADALRDGATALIANSGFTGRLIVMGDPDLAVGDGRIEWVDGGLVRDQSAILADIDQRIAAYLAAPAASHSSRSQPDGH